MSLTTKKQNSYEKNYMETYKFGKFFSGIWTCFFFCQVNSKLFWKAARFTTITQDLLRCSRNLSFCGSLPGLDLNDTCFWIQLSNHQNIEAKVSFLLIWCPEVLEQKLRNNEKPQSPRFYLLDDDFRTWNNWGWNRKWFNFNRHFFCKKVKRKY